VILSHLLFTFVSFFFIVWDGSPCHHHRRHHVHEGLGVFLLPWSSKWNWSLHLFLGRPMFLRPFGLCCNSCFGILFVSILCTCCSHSFWCYFISYTIFCAPVFSIIHWFFSLSSFVIPSKCPKNFGLRCQINEIRWTGHCEYFRKEERKPVLHSCFMTSLSGFKFLGRIIVNVCVLIYNNSPTNTKSLDFTVILKH
jgi:hypothetical protein